MNVSLRRLFWGILGLLLLPLYGQAAMEELSTYINQPVVYDFTSKPAQPSINTLPVNGTIQMVPNTATPTSFDYILTYTPNTDFFGQDQFSIKRWKMTSPSSFGLEIVQFTVLVRPAEVIARHDYVTTTSGTPVDVQVLSNDFSSNGVLLLSAIPLVNNGSASFASANTLRFTPTPGFRGLAHFNYVVCNGEGTCDHGTVSINVLGTDNAPTTDRLKIFTKKNKPQDVLVPSVYNLISGPSNGQYDPSGAVPQYIPNNNFVGTDRLLFSNGANQIEVEVHVLNIGENQFAFDDEFHTTAHQSIEFNVLDNDLYGPGANSVNIGNPEYGTVEVVAEGQVVYTPAPGFSGVDKFTYSSNSPGGESETATVFVYVSNYEPVYTKFRMATPKQTPLIIGYDVPITTFRFEITQQGNLGSVQFYPGQVNTTIYGMNITGYNLIVYIPDETVNEGLDEFEITYCVTDPNDNCTYSKSVKVEMDILNVGAGDAPQCFGDCVWAGDTNFDGIVNMEDLLPLGLNMGEVGKMRPDVTFDYWYGQFAPDWSDPFNENPVNLKHLDTDGDSIVTALDTVAINRFYGRTHSLTANAVPFYNFVLYLDGPVIVYPGDLVELDMILGTPDNPAVDVYGFTFPFPYNPQVFKPASVEVDYSSSSWLTYNSPVLFMERNDRKGLVETGYTRTSGISATGHGEIGKVRFVVADDIAGFRIDDDEIPVTVGGGVATAMNSAGQTMGVRVEDFTLRIQLPHQETAGPEEAAGLNPDLLKVFPNPASDFLTVHLNGGNDFERVVVYNLVGQRLYDSGQMLINHIQIGLEQFNNGIYLLEVTTPKGVLKHKFEVLR